MLERFIGRIVLVCLWLSLLSTAGAWAEDFTLYKMKRTFTFTLFPEDEESQDATAAEVYITTDLRIGWELYGPCQVFRDEAGVRFKCTVTVADDGSYYFASRGIDAAGPGPVPTADTQPEAHVIVDTLPPHVELTAPVPGEVLRIGEELNLRWLARDEHFGETPIQLYFKVGNHDWRRLDSPQPNTGIYHWIVPDTGGQPLRFRIVAEDRAGNMIEDTVVHAFEVRPASDAGVVMTPETAKVIDGMASNPDGMPEVPDVPVNNNADAQNPETRQAPPHSPVSEYINEHDGTMNDPRPMSRYPEFTANDDTLPSKYGAQSSARAAYIAYVMAGNLVRQGRLKDALRYYRTAVDADPNFDQAWNDMALVYKELGAFMKADAAIVRALTVEPRNPQYVHNRGEIYQTAGLNKLQDPASTEEDLAYANELIHFAIKMYGRALEYAQREGRLAERAGTYFRLGEICYFANQDPAGARQYWNKVLDLHSPTPDLDNVMIDRGSPDEARTRQIYQKNTELRVQLETWQGWARAYIRQLNNLERGVAPMAAADGAGINPYQQRTLAEYQVQPTRAAGTPRAYTDRPAVPSYAQPGYGARSGVVYTPPPAPAPVHEKPRELPVPAQMQAKKPSFFDRLFRRETGDSKDYYRSREGGDWRNEYVPYEQR